MLVAGHPPMAAPMACSGLLRGQREGDGGVRRCGRLPEEEEETDRRRRRRYMRIMRSRSNKKRW